MDPKTGWFQPEQEGPAKEFWNRIWNAYTRLESNKPKHINETRSGEGLHSDDMKRNHAQVLNNNNNANNVSWCANWASTYGMNKNRNSLIGMYGGCPWRSPNKRYDSRAVIALHQEINDFYNYMSPTIEEHHMRLLVVKNIKSIILELWPAAKVEVFGSFRTGLYLPTSDIDLVVIGDWDQLPLRTLEDALLTKGICDKDQIKVLDKASVPIVKLTDKKSDVKVDISFNMNNGVRSAELIKEYKGKFPVLAKLVLVLKQFLLQRDLNEVFHGGISSYSLILMTVSFLQMHPRADVHHPDCNLGVLLIEFFELYGRKFNYMMTAIRLKNGGTYIPKQEIQKDMKDGHRPSMLCIEDPLTAGNDIGRGSFGALQVRQAFEYAYILLTQSVNPLNSLFIDPNESSILGRIVRVTDKVINYRNTIKENYPLIKMASRLETCCGSASPSTASDGSTSSLASSDSECDIVEITSGVGVNVGMGKEVEQPAQVNLARNTGGMSTASTAWRHGNSTRHHQQYHRNQYPQQYSGSRGGGGQPRQHHMGGGHHRQGGYQQGSSNSQPTSARMFNRKQTQQRPQQQQQQRQRSDTR